MARRFPSGLNWTSRIKTPANVVAAISRPVAMSQIFQRPAVVSSEQPRAVRTERQDPAPRLAVESSDRA